MPRYHRVVIVGVGLLGGSIGLALRQRGLADSVIGVGRTLHTLEQARVHGAVTEISQDLVQSCNGADLIVVGTPVQSIAEFIGKCCTAQLAENCCVTDVGSTKANICRKLTSHEHQYFCGSHPMAGSEKTGVANARANLFVGKATIVTPAEQTNPAAVARAEEMWRLVGSNVVRLTPEAHDKAVASISHLPHIVASALAAQTDAKLLQLSGEGWRDTTRVASGEVELWRQIISENRQPLLSALHGYADLLNSWIAAIDSDNQDQIVELLEAGKKVRDALANSDHSLNKNS